ncbi:hypothetical protein L202_06468 [Cryptococcus amylolentus CBS 6039]|uniref:OPT family small oligopeptide transporter n=2 Tax=Cryptococcus amylolentus TaxID=104669 RepID=A0A1E3HGN1_9TREE|nr:hypothetical protein L202_06468 [Cryptococcus amylolentus CBS 6039]ODN75285.1 hypothetical protein L202_06468 [Cryptococcus amylolentus CBS 6039]ODO03051.1 hypothetical protein I350_05896 [Cryptococcus amylolentus CBS 6273]
MDQVAVLPHAGHELVAGTPSDEKTIPFDKIPLNEKLDHHNSINDGSEVSEKEEKEIVTGLDAANYLLPIRDDGDQVLTFRSLVLGTLMAAFQASMNQIYLFKPTNVTISGSFMVLLLYFLGGAWALFLPRGDLQERKWRERGNEGRLPLWIRAAIFINPGPFSLKEHAIASITATSASNGAASVTVFATTNLFYDIPLSATTVILSTLSIGLFGYGLTGLLRPITVYHPESVYWTNIPIVRTLQSLHWDSVKDSKPMRYFWYAFGGMLAYQPFPAYIIPWLNSVSVPCLASMKATGSKADILTNLFGGSLSNEGLGILNFSFDWQYITSSATSMPLILQANYASGIVFCWIAFLAVYYGNAWSAKSLPFLSTTLHTASGDTYPTAKVFVNGILDESALERYGLPKLSGTYVWAMVVNSLSIGALVAHCIFWYGPDIWQALKDGRKGVYADRHHAAMKKYKEANWYWYVGLLVIAFVLGLVVVVKEGITLTWWAYIVALALGAFIAPFSTILYSRFGNGIATNQLMKTIAGVCQPGRPVANLYFSAWSHSVISQSLNLASDLKMGEYLKIPPRIMFTTQVYGTVFGAFINYVVMISVVNSHRELLQDTNGSSVWSGQYFQSQSTQASVWALAKYLYGRSGEYFIVLLGLPIGFAAVILHRVFARYVPRIGKFSLSDLNLPQFFIYSGYLGFNQTQSCVVLSQLAAGFFTQFYLRKYKPRIFRDYSYLVTAAWDGASLFVLFILSFAVFGAANSTVAFPSWWGNPADGYPDHCPVSDS